MYNLLKIYINYYQRIDKGKSLQPTNQQLSIEYLVGLYKD